MDMTAYSRRESMGFYVLLSLFALRPRRCHIDEVRLVHVW
jgi:hypothetical protein